MDDVLGVEVLEALDDLVDDATDEFRLQAVFVLLDEVEQVAIEIFEDQVDLALFLEGLLDAHHVVAFQHLQHLDLTLDGLTGKLVLIAFFEFLDRHSLPPEVPKPPVYLFVAFQTIPYAPSSITSIISYFCINKYNSPLLISLFVF